MISRESLRIQTGRTRPRGGDRGSIRGSPHYATLFICCSGRDALGPSHSVQKDHGLRPRVLQYNSFCFVQQTSQSQFVSRLGTQSSLAGPVAGPDLPHVCVTRTGLGPLTCQYIICPSFSHVEISMLKSGTCQRVRSPLTRPWFCLCQDTVFRPLDQILGLLMRMQCLGC